MAVGIVKLSGFNMSPAPVPVAEVYAADTFTRADSSTVGSTEIGDLPWTTIPSGQDEAWSIFDTKLRKNSNQNPGPAPKLITVNSGANGRIRGRFATVGVSVGFGFREAADGSGGWLLDRTAQGMWRLRTHTGTTYSAAIFQTSELGTLSNEDFELLLDGSSITLIAKGSTLWSGTNTLYQNNTRHGPWVTGTAAWNFDNFHHEEIL